MDQLDAEVNYYRSQAFAASTKNSYITHLKTYIKFCQVTGRPVSPPDSLTTMRYIAYLAQTLQYSSITQYTSPIRLMHAELGSQNPLQTWHVQSTLKGIKRVKGTSASRKLPITPQILLQLRNRLNPNKPVDCILWAAFITAFFTLLRKSNIVPSSPALFDPLRHPTRADISLERRGLSLTIKSTKTIQFRERELKVPIPYLPGHPLCPTTAIVAVLSLQGPTPASAPLFSFPTPQGLRLLTQYSFTSRLKSLLHDIGVDQAQYGSHSFRRGGASWAFQAGIPGEMIQILGDWQSDCYKRYLELDINTKFHLISTFSDNLPSALT